MMEPRVSRRSLSPGTRRLAADANRASTGTLVSVYSSSFEPYYQQPTSPRFTSARASADRVMEPRFVPVSHRKYSPPLQQQQQLQRPGDYYVRPRRRTFEVQDPSLTADVNTRRSHGTVPADRPRSPRSPLPRGYESGYDSDYYAVPSASGHHGHHRRYMSLGDTEYNDTVVGSDRNTTHIDPRDYAPVAYPQTARSPRVKEPREYENYSYTGPGEQVTRDLISTGRRGGQEREEEGFTRRSGRDRPFSSMSYDRYSPVQQSRRDSGPPPSTRGFDKIGRSDSFRNHQYYQDYRNTRDYDYEDVRPKRRTSTSRPTSYDPYSTEYPEYRGQNPRHSDVYDPRSLVTRDESRSYEGARHRGGSASGNVSSYAEPTRDVRQIKARGRDYGNDDYVRSRRRDAPVAGDYGYEDDRRMEYRQTPRTSEKDFSWESDHRPRKRITAPGYESSGYDDDSPGGRSRERESQRRRQQQQQQQQEPVEKDGNEVDRSKSGKGEQNDQHSDGEPRPEKRRSRLLEDGKTNSQDVKASEQHAEAPLSPKESETKATEKKADKPQQPLKGILKPPTEKFPEDPEAVREGVAPLKDAGKKGIPPNARWTKIDRRLVNPEALELGHERYEERFDYVIVLRVLSKEEIQRYAEKTKEIRDRREADYYRSLERRRRPGWDRTGSDDQDRERLFERGMEQLTIEASPEHAVA